MSKYELLLPKMGESVAEATIIKWLKAPGDHIEVDEAIMEIATDKVDSEIPSPVSGKLVEQLCKEDDIVQVGAVIAVIETDVTAQHETITHEPVAPPVVITPTPHEGPVIHEEPVINEQAIPGINQLKQEEPAPAAAPTVYSERFYSPLVKNIAATENISMAELDTIPGTGAEGRLTKDDLQAYVNKRAGVHVEKPATYVDEEYTPAPPVTEHVSAPTFTAEPEQLVHAEPTQPTHADHEPAATVEEIKPTPPIAVAEEPIATPIEEPLAAPVEEIAAERAGEISTPPVAEVPEEPVAEPKAEPQPAAAAAKPVYTTSGGDEIIEMDRMRRLIADHMVMSKHTSPHVTSFVEADVTNLVRWREKVKDAFEATHGERITFTPIFIEAVVKAIKDMPLINSSVNGNQIIKKKDINIGMATALPSGNLIVPVIHKASSLNLTGITKAVNDLAARARANKLVPDEVKNGTFTITNVGSFGNVMGTPIINQPQVAILAVGAIKKKPAVIETKDGDMIAIRHMMFLSLSYDHRVVDGALGGSFVRRVADYLENWDPKTEI